MAENAGTTEANALTVKMMASSPASEKKHRSNGNTSPSDQAANHGSPVTAKQTETLTPPAVTEKKPQTNGQASPVRLPANTNIAQAGKQCLEGFLKTDDRMRLAKERREERERSLAVREQAIREKERRAQLQYERTVEERWKRLEEQRLKEEQRRAAVEEKRRQQLEEEKERLEALMRRSLERSMQLENRGRRWVWGGSGPGHGDWENAPPLSAASALPYDLAAPSPAVSESGNVTSSPHRSPYRGSPSRRRGNAVFTEELGRGCSTAPSTPKKGSLRRERGAASPATGSPVRRADDVICRSASPATPKLTPKSRNQSPVTVRQYPASPLKLRPAMSIADHNKGPSDTNDKQSAKVRGQDPADKKPLQAEEAFKKSPDTAAPGAAGKMESPVQKVSGPVTPEKGHKPENPTAAARPALGQRGPDRGHRDEQSPKAGDSQKHNTSNLTADKSTGQSLATPAEKAVSMRTDAEEASRLLAEKRRLAHIHEQQERLKAELRKRQVDERVRGEEETRREEDELRARRREEEELQVQLDRERGVVQRQRQDRELMQQQEEQERQQRKKRIEEIMKRTRKNEGEFKREDSQEPLPPSPPLPSSFCSRFCALAGEVQVDSKPGSEVKAPPTSPRTSSAPGTQAPSTGAQTGSAPGKQAPLTSPRTSSAPGSQAPSTGAHTGSTPGKQAPPTSPRTSSAPGTQAPSTGAQTGSTPGKQAPPTSPRTSSAPGTQAPSTGAQTGSAPGKQAPPTSPRTSSAPGSQAPSTGAQTGSAPGRQAPPTSPRTSSAPSSQASPTSSQTGHAAYSWAKPQAPRPPSRQDSTEKRVESFAGSEKAPNAPVRTLPRSPSPNRQPRSAKTLDQKGERVQQKPQSGEEARHDDSSPAKGQVCQPKASAGSSPQKPENLEILSRDLEAAQAKALARVHVPNPQPQAHQEQKGEAQVKSITSEQAAVSLDAWALQQKSAAKMSVGPQVNGQGHQMTSQICAALAKTQANGQTPLQVTSKGVMKERSPASLPPLAVSRTPPPLISLELLHGGGGARDKSANEVQSMEISPVSKEELISIPQFSPVADVRPNSMSKTRALEDLLDLTGQVAYPKLPPSNTLGDCNKNLIEGVCSPGSETRVIANNPPASNKLNIQ
ncbi:MAP7 domain-containing protein 2a [Brachyhypopomus gauderio]|uniref:MAP7 domain-containing protein 2a n=1 Tax=Brachyhypopomus gauderio TaxID=698409 RepID=UPI0040418AE9